MCIQEEMVHYVPAMTQITFTAGIITWCRPSHFAIRKSLRANHRCATTNNRDGEYAQANEAFGHKRSCATCDRIIATNQVARRVVSVHAVIASRSKKNLPIHVVNRQGESANFTYSLRSSDDRGTSGVDGRDPER